MISCPHICGKKKKKGLGSFFENIYVKGGLNMTLENLLSQENILMTINNNLEYLFEIIPELKSMVGFDHKHPHHHLNVWAHTLYALSLAPVDFEIRLVLLLHDIGKPYCYQEGEIRNFRGHPKVSRDIAQKILERFNYDDAFIKEVCYLIEFHDAPISAREAQSNPELAYKRYLVQQCDAYAHHPLKLDKRIKYLKKVEQYFDKTLNS